MENRELLQSIHDRRQRGPDPRWLERLEERKLKEIEFHNRKRDRKRREGMPEDTYELLHGNEKYYLTIQMSQDYLENWIKTHSPGNVVLDFACGDGGQALKAARAGAAVAIGIDISDISVGNATRAAEQEGLSNALFIQADCENTGLPENSIDVILCTGMLHHLDLSYAFPEMRRLLKPGGKVLVVEALDYNPIIKLYRKLTPSMRTEWERNHILSLKDVAFARRFFDIGEIKYWHLFSVTGAFLRRNPPVFKKAMPVLNSLDKMFLSIPYFQRLAWQFTFELIKPN